MYISCISNILKFENATFNRSPLLFHTCYDHTAIQVMFFIRMFFQFPVQMSKDSYIKIYLQNWSKFSELYD